MNLGGVCPKHGYWMVGQFCPLCGKSLEPQAKCQCGHAVSTAYCPHCGAKQ